MQTKGEYTPGPWHTHLHGRPELDNEEWLVLADDENVNEGDSLICSVNTLSGDDARLIAAAPELLEALETCLPLLEKIEGAELVGDEGCLWAVEQARETIAKAKGLPS